MNKHADAIRILKSGVRSLIEELEAERGITAAYPAVSKLAAAFDALAAAERRLSE